jgi:hypothetical protein
MHTFGPVVLSGAPHGGLRRARRLLIAALTILAIGSPEGAFASGVAPAADPAAYATDAASWCSSSVGTPTTYRSGTTVVADNFESGSLTTKWTKTDEGDAWAGVTTSFDHSGACAGRLVVTNSWTSRANIRRGLPSGTDEVWASGWFRVNKQGYWGSNVPTFRLFNGSTRILDVHRQNISGAMWLRTRTSSGSWRYVKLGPTLALGRWYYVEVHVRTAWSSSYVTVWLNGTMLYRNAAYSLPTSRLTTVMIGAEHYRQLGDLGFDDVVVKAS